MTEKEGLRQAKALIQDPSSWCQGSFGKDAHGHGVPANSPNAIRHCALGAMIRVRGGSWIALHRAAHQLFNTTPSEVNDQLGHEAVMQMYDLAIELSP